MVREPGAPFPRLPAQGQGLVNSALITRMHGVLTTSQGALLSCSISICKYRPVGQAGCVLSPLSRMGKRGLAEGDCPRPRQRHQEGPQVSASSHSITSSHHAPPKTCCHSQSLPQPSPVTFPGCTEGLLCAVLSTFPVILHLIRPLH